MSARYDCSDETARAEGLAAAAAALARGQLVVIPTDTVYGLAADAFSPNAVAALLELKGRGRDMPVPVLVGSWQTLDGLTVSVPDAARALVETFWPGPLTIVLHAAPSLAWDLGDSRGTVAVRMPLHPVALDLLATTGPLAVSSANRTGEPPATDPGTAQVQLGSGVAVYLDAGVCGEPVPSTIVDLTGLRSGGEPRVLRVGALSVEQVREVLPELPDPQTP
ncbi:MAG: L-threonylcarbamoyladenylate synthase [Actinomycetota bacterium]|nr:L-threonylcarbamoyladenylate synthase [Actinomycetota bacterium]